MSSPWSHTCDIIFVTSWWDNCEVNWQGHTDLTMISFCDITAVRSLCCHSELIISFFYEIILKNSQWSHTYEFIFVRSWWDNCEINCPDHIDVTMISFCDITAVMFLWAHCDVRIPEWGFSCCKPASHFAHERSSMKTGLTNSSWFAMVSWFECNLPDILIGSIALHNMYSLNWFQKLIGVHFT